MDGRFGSSEAAEQPGDFFGGLFGGRQGQRRHRVHMIIAFVVSGIKFTAVAVLPAPCPAEHIFRRRIVIDDFAGLRVLQHVGLTERHIVFGTVRNAEGADRLR